MVRLTILYRKNGERPIAESFLIPEDEPISIFDIKERFVPRGYELYHWAFNKLGLI